MGRCRGAGALECHPTVPPLLLTVQQFAEKHQAFTEPALRSLIFYTSPQHCIVRTGAAGAPGNELAIVLVRIDRRVLIDRDQCFRWARGGDAAVRTGRLAPNAASQPAAVTRQRKTRPRGRQDAVGSRRSAGGGAAASTATASPRRGPPLGERSAGSQGLRGGGSSGEPTVEPRADAAQEQRQVRLEPSRRATHDPADVRPFTLP
jgi:hypothetical protein